MEDRVNYAYNNRDSVNSNVFLEQTGLIELDGVNFSFTWFGYKNKKSRLDRVVVNDLCLSIHDWEVSTRHKRNYDHLPFILHSDYTD